MVDTGKLSLMNTGALAEQEKRMKRIESIVKAMEEGK
jgi:hypothetical protein